MKKTQQREFRTHKEKYEIYIADLVKNRGLIDHHVTTSGPIENEEEFYRDLLQFCRNGDNPKKYTVITSL